MDKEDQNKFEKERIKEIKLMMIEKDESARKTELLQFNSNKIDDKIKSHESTKQKHEEAIEENNRYTILNMEETGSVGAK